MKAFEKFWQLQKVEDVRQSDGSVMHVMYSVATAAKPNRDNEIVDFDDIAAEVRPLRYALLRSASVRSGTSSEFFRQSFHFSTPSPSRLTCSFLAIEKIIVGLDPYLALARCAGRRKNTARPARTTSVLLID